jgi:toxin YoeB
MILKKINQLIRDIQRNPFDGIGKPEALKNNLSGFWSRRITDEHRIVYCIHDDSLIIAQCRGHYD